MAGTETTTDTEAIIVATIKEQIGRRGSNGIVVKHESTLLEDLEMDSLELAELSAALEDKIGREPFSEGLVPETVGELVAFYNQN